MAVRKIIRFVCPLISVTCLAIGYTTTGPWIASIVLVFTLLAWSFAFKWPSGFLSSSALVLSVSLAAAGLLTGAMPLLMILGAALALAGWDVVLWNRAFTSNSLSTSLTLIEIKHYQSLAAALGLGLLAVVVGRLFRFQIPFGWMVILVIIALFSLERIWHTLIG
jgi:hypothetical protein